MVFIETFANTFCCYYDFKGELVCMTRPVAEPYPTYIRSAA